MRIFGKTFILLIFISNGFTLNANFANLNDILNGKKNYKIYSGDYKEKVFNAVRYINNNYSKEKIRAKNIYSTSKIDLYLENDLKAEDKELKNILLETMKVYEMEEYLYGKLENKLIILIIDINGGYTGDKPYMQGYSILEGYDKDTIKDKINEEKNIIFLDYINGWENMDSVINTIAHELQHVIHYEKLRESKGKSKENKNFDIWVDEAMSETAVISYRGFLPENRLNYYNNDSMYLITKGDYFINWSGGYTVHKYATVSLFMYWLGIQSKSGFEIYKDIAEAPKEYRGTYKAILYGANKNIKEFKDWSELYASWLKANYNNDTAGLYGYKGLIETKPKIITSSYNFSMSPGAAVYIMGDFFSNDKLLRYVELKDNIYIVYNPDINSKGKDRYLIVNSYY